ncbi:Rne/Rng family ribonuclease [Actinotalea sp. Marseille-Q4924]|uniref:Rne/Rng family ribonuclease n=1 Tax=Actinotalea sp. Marseille-Q4924 TaxID=2866571 RepID=UPI001CE3BD96|nr:Rne/Rng family ribonuclease [Actinotalea sp. Marseille-Q4924]
MSPASEPAAPPSAAPEQATAAPARSRRSRKPAAEPEQPTAAPAATTGATPPPDAPEAPPRRRRRKADAVADAGAELPTEGTPVAAQADEGTPDEAAGTAGTTPTPTTEGDPQDAAPTEASEGRTRGVRRGGRSRSTRGRAGADAAAAEPTPPGAEPEVAAEGTPVDAASADAAPGDTAPADAAPEGAPADDAPPARTRSRRGSRSRAGAAPDVAAPAAQPAPVAEGTLDVLAELGAARSAEPTPPDTDAPRRSATALLFQAPDPTTRPRRRRAQAPAGPPRAPEEGGTLDVVEAEDDVLTPVEDGAAGPEQADVGPEPAGEADAPESVEDEDGDDERTEDEREAGRRRRRRRGGRGRRSRSTDRPDGEQDDDDGDDEDGAGSDGARADGATEDGAPGATDDDGATGPDDEDGEEETGGTSRRRRRRRRSSRAEGSGDAEPEQRTTSSRRTRTSSASDEVTALKGSTRLEAKRQRRREGRDAGRRRSIITEAEFLARRESVDRAMVVREHDGRVQIAVLEDGVLVEHFVSRTGQGRSASTTTVGNVYLGRVQNVLPSMEAAFVDVGKGRNAVLYAGEVNWDAAGMEGQPRRIEQALKSGDSVLVQVTKDPIGHKGARLTSQVTLAGRYLVYVPGGAMTGISRKLPDTERARLKKLLKEIVPDDAGVIVRTAAEGASDEELRRDVQRLQEQWAAIEKKAKTASAPALLQGEPDMAIRVVRDIFNDDFRSLVVQGDDVHSMIEEYVSAMAPDLADRVTRYTGTGDVFADHRVDEQLAKGMDRKVWLPSGGSLVIDRTEAMTVVDVNTGKFTGAGGTLEETVTRNNLEAAEEIVRQLRLRDIGGIIVIDFIDMVLESNRDLVLRRLVECLGRDRTKHQVAEVTSLGLVQMTRKRVGQGLVESFSETCEHCNGRGFVVHSAPVERPGGQEPAPEPQSDAKRSRRKKSSGGSSTAPAVTVPVLPEAREAVKATLATIAAAAAHAHEHEHPHEQASAVVLPELEQLARAVGSRDGSSGAGGGAAPTGQGPDGTAPAALAELADAVGSIRAVEAPAPGSGDPGAAVAASGDQAVDGTGTPSDGAGAAGEESGPAGVDEPVI